MACNQKAVAKIAWPGNPSKNVCKRHLNQVKNMISFYDKSAQDAGEKDANLKVDIEDIKDNQIITCEGRDTIVYDDYIYIRNG